MNYATERTSGFRGGGSYGSYGGGPGSSYGSTYGGARSNYGGDGYNAGGGGGYNISAGNYDGDTADRNSSVAGSSDGYFGGNMNNIDDANANRRG